MLEDLRENRLIAALSRADCDALLRSGQVVELRQGTIVCEAEDEAEHVYFPLSGAISLLVVLDQGKAVETATVGREGVVSAMPAFGMQVSQVRAIVQNQLVAFRISAASFRKLTASHRAILEVCVKFNETLLVQARTIAACNTYHTVQQRFCRWLLFTADRVAPNEMKFTQETIAELVGARRTSVSDVASRLSAAGLISYSRGNLKINDADALAKMSCECFATLRRLAPS